MRAWLVLMLIVPLVAAAQMPGFDESQGEHQRREEAQVPLPQYPKPENYLPFQVSATTPFGFFVDAKSISVGADGVVRYTVIAKSPDGVLNISFEGMRCADGEFRVYAFGKSDNTWFKPRDSKWKPIRSESRNAQRAVLYSDYFCAVTGNIASAEDGVRALKSGGSQGATTNGY